ncbi:hypothetical protein EVA_18573, partial [gut metagenome]
FEFRFYECLVSKLKDLSETMPMISIDRETIVLRT